MVFESHPQLLPEDSSPKAVRGLTHLALLKGYTVKFAGRKREDGIRHSWWIAQSANETSELDSFESNSSLV